MNHFNALLNVLEILEVDKNTAKQILEHYIVEFLQISVSQGGEVSEEDFQAMKEVAVSLGLNEKEFEDAFESKMEDGDEKDKYDNQLDNVTDTSNFNNFLNSWIKPADHDERYLY